jgi:hypothetical protein
MTLVLHTYLHSFQTSRGMSADVATTYGQPVRTSIVQQVLETLEAATNPEERLSVAPGPKPTAGEPGSWSGQVVDHD